MKKYMLEVTEDELGFIIEAVSRHSDLIQHEYSRKDLVNNRANANKYKFLMKISYNILDKISKLFKN